MHGTRIRRNRVKNKSEERQTDERRHRGVKCEGGLMELG